MRIISQPLSSPFLHKRIRLLHAGYGHQSHLLSRLTFHLPTPSLTASAGGRFAWVLILFVGFKSASVSHREKLKLTGR